MRPTQHLTGILLVAAFAAVGCSKHEDKTTKASPPEKAAAAVKPTLGTEFGEGFVGTPPKATVSLPITFADGEVLEHRKDQASGSARNPMTPAQLEDKFMDCAVQAASPDVAKKILAALNALPDRRSLADVWPLLGKA